MHIMYAFFLDVQRIVHCLADMLIWLLLGHLTAPFYILSFCFPSFLPLEVTVISAPYFLSFLPLTSCHFCPLLPVISAPYFLSFLPLTSCHFCPLLPVISAPYFLSFLPLTSCHFCPLLPVISAPYFLSFLPLTSCHF